PFDKYVNGLSTDPDCVWLGPTHYRFTSFMTIKCFLSRIVEKQNCITHVTLFDDEEGEGPTLQLSVAHFASLAALNYYRRRLLPNGRHYEVSIADYNYPGSPEWGRFD